MTAPAHDVLDAATPFVFERPAWARGTIRIEDAQFLHDLVMGTRPHVAVEVGVASGCSSLVLLKALRHAHGEQRVRWRLHAYDLTDRCYFDPQYATGAAVGQFAPHLLPHYHLSHGDASAAREHVAPGSVTFAFVDANHFHPWPALDLLLLLPILAPGAWVVLHDVRLPRLQARSLRGHGPAYLFDAWPFEKRAGGYQGNTGAVRLPDTLADLDAVWPRVLEQPWECSPPPEVLSELGVTPRPVAEREMRTLRVVECAIRDGRSLCVWGTGEAARTLAASLQARGVALHALVERDEARRSAALTDLPVLAPEAVRAFQGNPPLVLVTGTFREPIARQLLAEGWRRDADFVVL